jgi:O-antigen biosynthesis protein WbqP
MIRLLDLIFSLVGIVVGAPLFILIWVLCWVDTGCPLFRQERVGRKQTPFLLLKFRTMRPDTASVPTHLVDASAVTKLGGFLRRTKLDELPQLLNVLAGEMSIVGPRPCLLKQHELIRERADRGVFVARPGITGLAQINGVDMSTPRLLAETDARMLQDLDIRRYMSYIIQTLTGSGRGDRVRRKP